VKHVAPGVFLVDMGRVHIARHDGKEVDILHAQGTHQARGLAQLHLIKGPVFYMSIVTALSSSITLVRALCQSHLVR
jgi:hypothetical protein